MSSNEKSKEPFYVNANEIAARFKKIDEMLSQLEFKLSPILNKKITEKADNIDKPMDDSDYNGLMAEILNSETIIKDQLESIINRISI